MDAKKIFAALAVLALSTSLCQAAGHSGKVRFVGQVVEAGCWNVAGTYSVTCQHNNATAHYQLASASRAALPVSNANVVTRWLNGDKSLELMQITYN